MVDKRNEGSGQTLPDGTTTPPVDTTTTTTTSDTTGQTNGDTKTRPYNLIVAIVCVGVAVVAFVLTMWLFQGLIEEPEDVAIVSGALGVLFTLIGTVAGAYFGIKSTNDTTDKAITQVEEANARTERANQAARQALKG